MFLIGELANAVGYADLKFWGSKVATVQRQIYEKSPSYIEGHVQDLRDAKYQYDTTKDVAKKAAIASYTRGNLEKLDPADVPSDLKDFYNTINGN